MLGHGRNIQYVPHISDIRSRANLITGAFCNNYAALIACRLLLGVFESGLFPGVILYLSMFYNKKSLSLRQAYFYGTSAIAGAVGGLVAYAIGDLDGTAGWSGWRWVFMINGVPTVLTAFFVPFVLPNSPETAKFLSEEDQRNMILLRSSELGQTRAAQEFDKKDVWDGAKDWKTYAFAIGQFIGLSMLYSLRLPTYHHRWYGCWVVASGCPGHDYPCLLRRIRIVHRLCMVQRQDPAARTVHH